MVTQRPLEPLFMVRVHAGQPLWKIHQSGLDQGFMRFTLLANSGNEEQQKEPNCQKFWQYIGRSIWRFARLSPTTPTPPGCVRTTLKPAVLVQGGIGDFPSCRSILRQGTDLLIDCNNP